MKFVLYWFLIHRFYIWCLSMLSVGVERFLKRLEILLPLIDDLHIVIILVKIKCRNILTSKQLTICSYRIDISILVSLMSTLILRVTIHTLLYDKSRAEPLTLSMRVTIHTLLYDKSRVEPLTLSMRRAPPVSQSDRPPTCYRMDIHLQVTGWMSTYRLQDGRPPTGHRMDIHLQATGWTTTYSLQDGRPPTGYRTDVHLQATGRTPTTYRLQDGRPPTGYRTDAHLQATGRTPT